VTFKHSRYVEEDAEVKCAACGSSLRRLSRKGFLQTRVYPFFGYYPWECPLCRQQLFIKKKLQHKNGVVRQTPAN